MRQGLRKVQSQAVPHQCHSTNATLSSKNPLKQRLLMLVKWCLCVFLKNCTKHLMLLGSNCLLSQGMLWDLRWLLASSSPEVGNICCSCHKFLQLLSVPQHSVLKYHPAASHSGLEEHCHLREWRYINAVVGSKVAGSSTWVASLNKMQADLFSLLSSAQHVINKVTTHSQELPLSLPPSASL